MRRYGRVDRTVHLIVEELSGLRPFRAELGAALEGHGIDADTAMDVQLASSELITNGLTHGGAAAVELSASIGPDSVALVIDHVESSVGPRRPTAKVMPIDQGGRGLHIVGALSSDIATNRTGDHWSTSFVVERRTS